VLYRALNKSIDLKVPELMNDCPTPIQAPQSENHISQVLGDECLLSLFPSSISDFELHIFFRVESSLGIPKVAIWVRVHTPGFLM